MRLEIDPDVFVFQAKMISSCWRLYARTVGYYEDDFFYFYLIYLVSEAEQDKFIEWVNQNGQPDHEQ